MQSRRPSRPLLCQSELVAALAASQEEEEQHETSFRMQAACGVHAPASAFDANSPSVFNVDGKGLALKGYDPVAYFSPTGAGPVLGKAEFTATVDSTVYRFVSAANRDAFIAARGRYLPGYGGFCAMAVTRGKKVDADPRVWRVEEGRLYLHANKDEQKRWDAAQRQVTSALCAPRPTSARAMTCARHALVTARLNTACFLMFTPE